MNKKRVIVLIGLLCLVAAASPLVLNKVNPSRALAPSIFISYDDEGIESRIHFSITEDGSVTEVYATEDGYSGIPDRRQFGDTEYEYDPITKEVVFYDRVWQITGEDGHRVLENTYSEYGELWGKYYEDINEAKAAEPYTYS